MHLIIDGYGSNSEILQSEEFIYQLLDEYPAEIGMTKISSPVVVRYTGDDWGISGFVMIAESHISIHTFVERGYVSIDVFSCKDFDTTRATKDLSSRLQLTEIRTHFIDRSGYESHPEEKNRIAFTRL
jgi:S-adenosylmethionine decarboxylase